MDDVQVLPYASAPSRRADRPALLWVLAVAGMVLGALGVGAAVLRLLLVIAKHPSVWSPVLQRDPNQWLLVLVVGIGRDVLAASLGALLLWASTDCWRLRPRARRALIFYAAAATGLAVVEAAIMWAVVMPWIRWVLATPADWTYLFVPLRLVTAVASPALVLLAVTRPSVVRAFEGSYSGTGEERRQSAVFGVQALIAVVVAGVVGVVMGWLVFRAERVFLDFRTSLPRATEFYLEAMRLPTAIPTSVLLWLAMMAWPLVGLYRASPPRRVWRAVAVMVLVAGAWGLVGVLAVGVPLARLISAVSGR